ncbi:Aste57867_13202 [Aphanomyces stellatus]|uniref:Aste57867_13202 protein n=1 Tax=Aphanomyces stellatus TaxID=120398 RepID=A0A485KYE1_9STRA|nr:hypothetical protein As57867_013153 [Aphanomyces stellatus]VFT90042.1 Aste57867_13202 [Aphanomyces stellatus]
MIRYCGREHQMEHFPLHKSSCSAVKKAADSAAHELSVLVAIEGFDIACGAGQFWRMYETRPYMLSLAAQIDALEAMGTETSLHAAVDLLFECFRLNRSDNMGLRDVLPGILLRLQDDQALYDFARWWAQDRPHYEWENTSLPYLDTRGADATESPDVANFTSPYGGPSLHHLVAVVLVKFRVLEDLGVRRGWRTFLRGTHRARLRGHVPLLHRIHRFLSHRSNATPADNDDDDDPAIETLERQITRLLLHTQRKHPRIWKALVHPAPLLATPDPDLFSLGDENEVKKAVVRLLPAWRDTPGAIDRLIAHVGSAAPNYDSHT